jgi:hypothetical protein
MTIPDVCHFFQSTLCRQNTTGTTAYIMDMRLGKPGDVCICVGMAVADEGQNRNFGVQ